MPQQYSQEELRREAERRGLVTPQSESQYSRDELLREAQRRGLQVEEEPVGFLGGVREEIPTLSELGQLVTGVGGFLQNAVTPGKQGLAAESMSRVVPAIAARQRGQMDLAAEQFLKAEEAEGFGSKMRAISEGIGRFAAGAIPVIGPQAASVGETFGQGEIARGVGRMVGMFGPELLTYGATKFVPASRVTGVVPLQRSLRPGPLKGPAEFLEGLSSRSLTGVTRWRRFRRMQQQKLIDDVTADIMDDVNMFDGTADEVGAFAMEKADEFLETAKKEAGKMYDEIDRRANPSVAAFYLDEAAEGAFRNIPDVRKSVSLDSQKSFARKMKKRLEGEVAAGTPRKHLDAQFKEVDGILKADDAVSFRQAQDARSTLLAIARRHGDPIPGKSTGIVKKLAKLTDGAMIEGARKVGGDELVALVREANDMWRKTHEMFDDAFMKQLVRKDIAPEKIHGLITKMPVEQLPDLRAAIGADAFSRLARRSMQDTLDKALKGELSTIARESVPEVGQSITGIGGATQEFGQVLRGQSFQTLLENNYKHGRLQKVFGEQSANQFDELARLAKKVGLEEPGRLNASIVSGFMNGMVIQGVLRAAGGDVGALFSGLGGGFVTSPVAIAVGNNLLARMMTKPEGMIVLRGFLRASGRDATRPITFWSRRMAKFLIEDGVDPDETYQQLRQGEQEQAQQPEPPEPTPFSDAASSVSDALQQRGGAPVALTNAADEDEAREALLEAAEGMDILTRARMRADNPKLNELLASRAPKPEVSPVADFGPEPLGEVAAELTASLTEQGPPILNPSVSVSPADSGAASLSSAADATFDTSLPRPRTPAPTVPLDVENIPSPHHRPRTEPIDLIVLHHTGTDNIGSPINEFSRPGSEKSAHFIIGKDGRIVQMVDEEEAAFHARDLNDRSIGIELVGDGNVQNFTDEQYEALSTLVAQLVQRHPDIKRVWPHSRQSGKVDPGKFFDPGRAGMSVRAQRNQQR